MLRISRDELTRRCQLALQRTGAAASDAHLVAEATVEAEALGNRAVGLAHLSDYLDGYRQGRITPTTRTVVTRRAPGVVTADAGGGVAQVAFHHAEPALAQAIREAGVASLWIRGSFTCGELGFYPRRLAQQGFIALGMANSPALMSMGGSPRAVIGTNPVAYAVPRPGRLPLVVDQASSATAFVNIRRAAKAGEKIPEGWALGPDGQPTKDAAAALQGALLPFGAHRGGNVALLVELLATLSGASFSVEAPPFDEGHASPGIGLFLLGIDTQLFPGTLTRLSGWLDGLSGDHGVYLPALLVTHLPDQVDIAEQLLTPLEPND